MDEFDLIARIRARAVNRDDVVLGIGDDAALVQISEGQLLAIATDTLNEGVHFPTNTSPADLGWKALAVNLSDLAAMAVQPAWCTLSLSLPRADATWLEGFLDGFLALAELHHVALIGGDTSRGPLSVCVTVHGLIAPERAVRREGAQADDRIWVSGTLGDAAAALSQWRAGADIDPQLRARLDRPTPRVATGRALAGVAHAAIDISDGLLADLGHLCDASGVGAEVRLDTLPLSDALRTWLNDDDRYRLQAMGGDDYELCFTAAPAMDAALDRIARQSGVALTQIGRIMAADTGVRALLADGSRWHPEAASGYVHFT